MVSFCFSRRRTSGSQLIVNLTGLQIVRIHLVDRCYDPLCLKLRQDQHTKHNENTHGDHDRNGMKDRGQCAFCGTCYPDHASIAQTGCVIIGLLRRVLDVRTLCPRPFLNAAAISGRSL